MVTGVSELTYENVSEWMLEELPNLEETYRAELEWWRDEMPGPHIVFGDIFLPYLRTILRGPDLEAVRHALRVAEVMAQHPDHRIREVVALSILEPLAKDADAFDCARSAMGPATRRLCISLARSISKRLKEG
jgi:hypothetical protein